MVFDDGKVYCHRGCDWRVIRETLGTKLTHAARSSTPSSATLRWSDIADSIWKRAHSLRPGDVVHRYLSNRGCAIPERGVIRLTGHGEPHATLHVAEGIETALTIARVRRSVWATVDGGNLAKLPPLPDVATLEIYADNDANGAGARYAARCAKAWRSVGKSVAIDLRSQIGDWNDVARKAMS